MPTRVFVQAQVTATAGRITAHDVSISDPDVLGGDYVSCITRAYTSISTDAPSDQKDGEVLVHMPWTVP